MPKPRIDAEEIAKITEYKKQGLTNKQIGSILGYSESKIARYAPKDENKLDIKEAIYMAQCLIDNGASVKEAAAEAGICVGTVRLHCDIIEKEAHMTQEEFRTWAKEWEHWRHIARKEMKWE